MEKKLHRGIVNAWCLYDWGNSAFSTTVEAAVLPVYFKEVAGKWLPGNMATVYWGYAAAFALLVGAVLAPILGSIGDYTGGKKRYLSAFAALGVVATAALALVGEGDWPLALACIVVGSVGFAGAAVFYDSLLLHIAGPEEIDYVSSKGYALGYLGGGLLLAVNIAMIQFLPGTLGAQLSFLSVAVWWGAFTVPLLRRVPEPPADRSGMPAGLNPVRAGFRRLGETFRHLQRYRQLLLFLVAFWLYNDGIGTIIKMATIYGAEVGIGMMDLIGALLLTQFVGIPFSLLFGKFGTRIGTKRAIMLGLGWYTLIACAGYFLSQAWHFWALACAVGMVQGGTQALSRSLFGLMVPKGRSAEFYGFYDVSSKIAGIAGPALFALVGQLTGTSRLSIVALVVFFIGGTLLLTQVDEKEGIRAAEVENRAAAVA
jgi:UMF1 family MFS transporter